MVEPNASSRLGPTPGRPSVVWQAAQPNRVKTAVPSLSFVLFRPATRGVADATGLVSSGCVVGQPVRPLPETNCCIAAVIRASRGWPVDDDGTSAGLDGASA